MNLDVLKRTLRVKEIFFSLQGEGARVGTPNIFIRLAGCNKNCSFCDTDWKDGVVYTVQYIFDKVIGIPCNSIIWTGGEPALQLDNEIVDFFKEHDYYQAIETNGSLPIPTNIDYVVCSPKEGVTIPDLWYNFHDKKIDEFRYLITAKTARQIEDTLPKIFELPKASYYCISPVFDVPGKRIRNLKACLDFIKSKSNWDLGGYNGGEWRLSIQLHKLIGIL